MRAWFSSVLVLAACTDGTVDGTLDDPVACDATVASFDPVDATLDVLVDTSVTATFSEPVPDGENWTLEITGVEGTATLADDRSSATFVPAAPLAFETAFTIAASVCDDAQSAEFATVAAPVDASLVEGNTFAIAEEDLDIVTPKALGAILAGLDQPLFGSIALQLTTFDVASGTFDAQTTTLDSDGDPICEFLVSAETDYSANPFITFGPEDLTIEVAPGQDLTLEGLEVTGRVAEDGQSLTDSQVSLLIALETVPFDLGIAGFDDLPSCPDALKAPLFKKLLQPECAPCSTSDSGECLVFQAVAETAALIEVDLAVDCAPETM